MYATSIDYKKLYSNEYFGKTSNSTSFHPDEFTLALLEFLKKNSIKNLVDVGSGSGYLARFLRENGVKVITCDFSPIEEDGIHINLGGSSIDAEDVSKEIRRRFDNEKWITTCFDVLQRIDIEEVGHAVQNLKIISNGLFLSSISTMPSSHDNRYHTTILPKSTWIRIFEMSGFKIEDDNIFKDKTNHIKHPDHPDSEEFIFINYWKK